MSVTIPAWAREPHGESGAANEERERRSGDDAEHPGEEAATDDEEKLKRPQERWRPLTNRNHGEDMAAQVSTRLDRALVAARRTKSPRFTDQGDQVLVAATGAFNAQESKPHPSIRSA